MSKNEWNLSESNIDKFAAEANLSIKYILLGFFHKMKDDVDFALTTILILSVLGGTPFFYHIAQGLWPHHDWLYIFAFFIGAAGASIIVFALIILSIIAVIQGYRMLQETNVMQILYRAAKYLNTYGYKKKYRTMIMLSKKDKE